MDTKQNVFLACVLISMVASFSIISAQIMKCTYGERGSLTSTCMNATPAYFRSTTYRFDNLDETVRCTNCNLETLEPSTFDISGNQIINLDITNSKVQNIKESAFVGLVFLKNLCIQDNKIKNIFPGVFRGIKKLEHLHAQNNTISALTSDGFKELVNLQTLNLENNLIKSIDTHAFNGLSSLQDLNLAHNRINDVQNVFQTLPSITSINLSNNEITNIHALDFTNLTTLIILNLSNNKLTSLSNDTFLSLKSLEKMYLSNNKIHTIQSQAFRGLSILNILYIDSNEIHEIAKGTFLRLSELRELVLAGNNLTYFKTGLFSGLPELKYLNLTNNSLVKILRTGVLPLLSLHTLDLSDNLLMDFDYKLMFEHMPKLTYLGLDKNIFPCDLIQEMDTYFEHDNIKLSADGYLRNDTCKSRPKHAMMESKALQDEIPDLDGNSYASAYVVYTFISLILIMICVIFFLQYRMDNYLKYYSGASKSTSQVNLVSSDLNTRDDF